MKRSRPGLGLMVCALAAATGAGLAGGCSTGQQSPATLSANEAMAVPESPRPARQRGLMVAGDSLGRAVFADPSPAMASVPER